MFKKLFPYVQYILPQHLLSVLAGKLARVRAPWFKNWFILRFIKIYNVNMRDAAQENPENYLCFNDFFTRHLKSGTRPMADEQGGIVSPVDGMIAQIGEIKQGQLLQAKHFYFDLTALLGGDQELARIFSDGAFSTLYLAPHDYHRVHMPLAGKLDKTIFVPGNLFSVNKMTSQIIPNLFSRNERFISIFNTEAGPMAVILVGALIVGSIQMAWMNGPARDGLEVTQPGNVSLAKGDELGYFHLGSTVILLFGKDQCTWQPSLRTGTFIRVGELMGLS